MNKFTLKLSLIGLLAVAVAGTPLALRAQTTSTNAAPEESPHQSHTSISWQTEGRGQHCQDDHRWHGNNSYHLRNQNHQMRQTAMFEEGIVGDDVAGAYHKNAEGKSDAISLRFGPKPTPESGSKTNNASVS